MSRRVAAAAAGALALTTALAGLAVRSAGATAPPAGPRTPAARAAATLPKVTWLPAGYTLQIHRDTADGPLDVYRQMSERDRIEKLHGAPIGSVAISPAPSSKHFLQLPHTVRLSGTREYLVFTERHISVVWPAGGVQVTTSRLSLADTLRVVDGLVAS